MLARLKAFYALSIYAPASRLAGRVRPLTRTLRGLPREKTFTGALPSVSWRTVIPARPIRLVECRKTHGNVRLNELAILANAAASVPRGTEIIEIGTFDGRTTLNLAMNSASTTPVFTLDLPRDVATKFSPRATERQFIDKLESGARFRNYPGIGDEVRARITQLTGDSAQYDWSAHLEKAGLVFVDGSHAYEYAIHDTEEAFRLVARTGVIIWHDYGVWKGVTQALDEIESARRLGLRHLRGTSLVFWQKP